MRDSRRSSYFKTDRGLNSVSHEIERLKTELLERARFIEISFEGDYETLKDIDTDTTLRLETDKIPNGAAVGKVVSYRISFNDNGERLVFVKIAVSIGTGVSVKDYDAGIARYVDATYDNLYYQEAENAEYLTPSGAVFKFSEQVDIKEPINPWYLESPSYCVSDIMISGHYTEQYDMCRYAAMENQGDELAGSIINAIDEVPTRMQMRMRNISPMDMLKVKGTVESEPIDIPRGINLDGLIEV